jgi:hypothetical protein
MHTLIFFDRQFVHAKLIFRRGGRTTRLCGHGGVSGRGRFGRKEGREAMTAGNLSARPGKGSIPGESENAFHLLESSAQAVHCCSSRSRGCIHMTSERKEKKRDKKISSWKVGRVCTLTREKRRLQAGSNFPGFRLGGSLFGRWRCDKPTSL